MGYTKLFSDIVMSTIWREPDHVRIVWITMLALRDRWHTVQASIPGLADAARVTVEQCKEALQILSSPDPDSRSQEDEGRRIKKCEGGWFLINGEKYRNRMSLDERREYNRIKQREYRAKAKENQGLSASCVQSDTESAQTETETEIKMVVAKAPTIKRSTNKPRFSPEDAAEAPSAVTGSGPKALIAAFRDEYTRRVGKKYAVTWGKEMKLAVAALKEVSFDEIVSVMSRYFENCEPKWWSFQNFCANFNRFQAMDAVKSDPLRVERAPA